MTYIFEKNISMPICAFYKNNYINYLTGEILSSTYFNNKKYIKKDINLHIYKILDHENKFIAFNYMLNDISNYLDYYKQPIKDVSYIKKKLMNNDYYQELIWGEVDE